MKFTDPFQILNYMGGAPPIHLLMAIYATIVYSINFKSLACDQLIQNVGQQESEPEISLYFQDITMLIFSHIIYFIFNIIKSYQHTLIQYGAYTKVFFVNFSFGFYMASFIYCIYNLQISNDMQIPTQDQNCLNQQQNYENLLFIKQFRQTEIVLFISQILSVLIYIIQSKLFILMKRVRLNQEEIEKMEKNDPLWSILMDRSHDYLANDNYIMVCTTLQHTNIFVIILQSTSKLDVINNPHFNSLMHFIRLPLSLIFYIFWCIFIWKGTTFDKLFTSNKIKFVTRFAIADVLISLLLLSLNFCFKWNLDSLETISGNESCTYDKIFIFIICFSINLYVYGVYLYFGVYKQQNNEQINFQNNENLQKQEEMSKLLDNQNDICKQKQQILRDEIKGRIIKRASIANRQFKQVQQKSSSSKFTENAQESDFEKRFFHMNPIQSPQNNGEKKQFFQQKLGQNNIELQKKERYIYLQEDFYCLAFFQFYINSEENQDIQMLNYLKSSINDWSFGKIEDEIKYIEQEKKRLINVSMNQEYQINDKIDFILQNSKEKITRQELYQFLNKKQSLKRKQRADILLRALLLFSIQSILLVMMLNYLVSGHQQKTPEYFTQQILKIVCSFIFHIFIQPTIKQSLSQIKYLYSHFYKFEQTFIPFMLCAFRTLIYLGLQIIELGLTFSQEEEPFIIMCFIDVMLIAYIHQHFYDVIPNNHFSKQYFLNHECKLLIEQKNIDVLNIKEIKFDNQTHSLNKRQKVSFLMVVILEFLYESLYFYFFPFFILFIYLYKLI